MNSFTHIKSVNTTPNLQGVEILEAVSLDSKE
jgi:hypothetical protein